LNSGNQVVAGAFEKSEIVPLHQRMLGGGSAWEMMPFGDHQRRLVIALSASAERLAAM